LRHWKAAQAAFDYMGATYSGGANPSIDYVRLLVADTNTAAPIFQDSEITAAMSINQAVGQSSMFYSYSCLSQYLPQAPSNYLRAAALLLTSMAGNSARLASVVGLLDVKLNAAAASTALLDTAQRYLDMDDNSGAFAIAEQVNTVWSFRDRWLAMLQRQTGGGFFT